MDINFVQNGNHYGCRECSFFTLLAFLDLC
nr:MAG TPA: hypothetical protein [Bacteriophage sp.]